MNPATRILRRILGASLFAAALAASASAAEPIQIGFSMALTGGGAANGKVALLAMKIWEADVNAKGGLLGRPVKLVYYDDQTSPANVPGIYTKLSGCRQGRAHRRALFDHHERAAHADRDGAQHGGGEPHRLGRQRPVPLRQIFLVGADGAGFEDRVLARVLQRGRRPKSLRRRPWRSPRATRNSPGTPPTARAPTPRRTA